MQGQVDLYVVTQRYKYLDRIVSEESFAKPIPIMKIKLVLFKKQIPDGYHVVTWKTATGQERYSTFQGDDRLMSFRTHTEAVAYATKHKNNGG
ncbi:hypothetical protein ABDD95_05505 [Mucilaginibacter sp. PAMB04274]|uniref:hypothetical protein n=1 Tax=Mucilaginibacter sp. PAMB04274 TaxID=3138568 RepID=UPI0031F60650